MIKKGKKTASVLNVNFVIEKMTDKQPGLENMELQKINLMLFNSSKTIAAQFAKTN